jgi:hypothetical protein
MGKELAIDATDLPAYANGQKYDGSGPRKKPFSDPDAAWGFRSAVSTRRGGGFYGYKLHAAACAKTGLPLAWRIESGNRQETLFALPLLDAVAARGFSPEACSFDKGRTTQGARNAAYARSSPFATSARRVPPFRRASTEHGCSRVPTSSATRPSTVAPPGSARPRALGSRPTAPTRSFLVPQSGGAISIVAAPPSGVSSGA